MRIFIPEGSTTNHGDLSWSSIESYGQLTIFEETPQEELASRCRNAQILITNKLKVGSHEIDQIPTLELICQLATGYDNIDLVAAKKKRIIVCNAVGYGTDAVAQHVFAMLLYITNHVAIHNQSVQSGHWTNESWSYTLKPLSALSGKTMGVYGYGKIGQATARIAQAFGMKIIVHTRTPDLEKHPDVQYVQLENLCVNSDVITLHAPLSKDNSRIINSNLLELMKENAILINTGRGGLIQEEDLRNHLLQHPKFTAALDVLSQEPPPHDHPLIGLPNCIITPHNAWVAREARQRLVEIVASNIEAYLKGNPQNTVG